MPFAITDVVTLDGVSLLAAEVIDRDCSLPITDLRRREKRDQFIDNLPVWIGRWENGTSAPSIKSQAIAGDPDTVVDVDCDGIKVSVSMTSCEFILPNMKRIILETDKPMALDKLIPLFCRQRGISPQQLGLLFDSSGNFVTGNPYAADFAKMALGALGTFMRAMITQGVTNGDDANDFEVDGIFTQIDNGWTDGEIACGDDYNIGNVINWAELTTAGEGPFTGTGVTASPDEETVADKTVTLFGTEYEVPAGLNLAQFLIYYIELVEEEVAANHDIEWHMIVPHGYGRSLKYTATCLQPCGNDSNYDPTIRQRWVEEFKADAIRLRPDDKVFGLLKSRKMGTNELRFGPRNIDGRPTYGVFYWNIAEYMSSVGMLADTYNDGFGMMPSDPLWRDDIVNYVPEDFENLAFYWNIMRTSINCAYAQMMTYYGALAVSRHLWLKITNVSESTFVSQTITGEATLDGAPIG